MSKGCRDEGLYWSTGSLALPDCLYIHLTANDKEVESPVMTHSYFESGGNQCPGHQDIVETKLGSPCYDAGTRFSSLFTLRLQPVPCFDQLDNIDQKQVVSNSIDQLQHMKC